MRYEIRHAFVQYGADKSLQDVNFEVHDSEKIAIVNAGSSEYNKCS